MFLDILLVELLEQDGEVKTALVVPKNAENKIVVDLLSDLDDLGYPDPIYSPYGESPRQALALGPFKVYEELGGVEVRTTRSRLREGTRFQKMADGSIRFELEHMHVPVGDVETAHHGYYALILPKAYILSELEVLDPYKAGHELQRDVQRDTREGRDVILIDMRSRRGSFSFRIRGSLVKQSQRPSHEVVPAEHVEGCLSLWEFQLLGKQLPKVLGSALGLLPRVPSWKCDSDHYKDIASYVFESNDFVSRITASATNELKRVTDNRHLSFASALVEGTPDTLRQMVEAIYLHLKNDYHLRYEFERGFDELSGEQDVRTPTSIAMENCGTCLDLVLLFLSCLANVKLWPVYIQVQLQDEEGTETGHALAATWLKKPSFNRSQLIDQDQIAGLISKGDLLAVDCTGFVEGYPNRQHKLSFQEACDEAKKFISANSVRFAVDIRRAWETGVKVLSRG